MPENMWKLMIQQYNLDSNGFSDFWKSKDSTLIKLIKFCYKARSMWTNQSK